MSLKNFVSYGDAETVLTSYANEIDSIKSRLSALENAGFLTSSDLPSMTQAQYDALQTKDKPYYFIVEE